MYAAAGNAIRQARKQGGKKAAAASAVSRNLGNGKGELLGMLAAQADNLSMRLKSEASSAEGKSGGDRRGSVSDVAAVQHRDKASKAHRRWVKKNRIRDASCGDDDDGFDGDGSGANVVLYVGLGLVCVGLVISFVGLGEKGFKTAELRLIGPSLLAAGALFCVLRVLFCTCPAICCCCCPNERRRRRRHKKRRRKLRGEPVSSSDDETIVKKQPKSTPHVIIGGAGSVLLNVKPSTSFVNGDNNKHVVIPIKRQPPTPSPPTKPSMLRVHSVTVSPANVVTLPNFICEDDTAGKSNPDSTAHVIETHQYPTTSRDYNIKPPPPSSSLKPTEASSSNNASQTLNKLQRPREKELVLNASMLQNV